MPWRNGLISMPVGLLAALAAMAQSANTSKPAVEGAKNSAQIEFVKIAPGEFTMGCVPGDMDCLEDEVPRHRVRLTKGFELGKYEVTQTQWEAVMGAGSNTSKTIGPIIPWIVSTKLKFTRSSTN
jgi:formylglycine-generating enzyme required for sulfatase activity